MEFFNRNKIDEYYPEAVMIPPTKVWKLPKNKLDKKKEVCDSGNYFAQPKIDGSCYIYEKTKTGKSYLYSRRVSTKTGLLVEKGNRVPHILDFLDSIVPNQTILVLEIYYPGEKVRNVTAIMGCNPPKAIERQKNKPLFAYIHDMLQYNGEMMLETGAKERYLKLVEVFSEIDCPNYINIAKCVEEDIYDFIQQCLVWGYEGAILKHKDGFYYPDKRPAWNMIKFKVEEEHDVVCLGFEPPTKEYKGKEIKKWQYWEADTPVTKPYFNGWIGAIKLGVYKNNGELAEIGTVSSGLTDDLLEQIKNNPSEFIGKPLKIKAMETTDNNLREKQFIEFREDIDSKDCKWEKIFS